MSETTTTTTVRLEVTVEVPQERAFALFVERFDEVKPRDHTLLTVPLARSVLEPFVGAAVVVEALSTMTRITCSG